MAWDIWFHINRWLYPLFMSNILSLFLLISLENWCQSDWRILWNSIRHAEKLWVRLHIVLPVPRVIFWDEDFPDVQYEAQTWAVQYLVSTVAARNLTDMWGVLGALPDSKGLGCHYCVRCLLGVQDLSIIMYCYVSAPLRQGRCMTLNLPAKVICHNHRENQQF